MTRTFPPGVPELGAYVVSQGGAYLHNVVRGLDNVCQVCSLPVSGGELCWQCRSHRDAGLLLADQVASITYAPFGPGTWNTQAHNVVRGYKGERPGPGVVEMMENLLRLGLRAHSVCAVKLVNARSRAWAVVPSTSLRRGIKLPELVRSLARSINEEVVVTSADESAGRQLNPDRWSIPEWSEGVPDHVLVIDDSWATGAHAQSLAALLKRSGVAKVSILTVARLLSPAWSENAAFEREHLRGSTFDWRLCPWTGGNCPD